MKKSTQYICILMLMVLCTIPAIAQLENNGYYRFRNADRTSEYISFTNNLFDHVTIVDKAAGGFTNLSGSAGQARALTCASRYMQTDIHLVEDEEFIDVSTIVYVLKKTTNNGYDLIGQSTSLANLTTGTVSHPNSTGKPSLSFKDIYAYIQRSSGSGATTLYTAYITLKGTLTYFGISSTQNLGDRYFIDREGVFDITEGNTTQNAKWYIEPIDHFNVKPTIALNGRFYTSIYVPFAFKLAGQVLKAYAITGINNDGTLNYEVAATTGGTVPAGTPVLLECGTDVVADCQLQPTTEAPLTSDATNYSGVNLLKSTYFCNTDGTIYYDTSSGTNAGSFNANHFTAPTNPQKYVLGFTDGKLGMIEATSSAMPANKAWLESAGVFPTLATPTITPASGTYTSAQTVTITAEEGATIEYSTDGGTTWQTYDGAFTVDETTTIQARAIKQGLYNNSDVVTSQIEISIPNPVLTVNPTSLTINDLGGSFTVEGSDLGTDNVGVTTNNGFATTTSDQYWGFVPNNGTVNGTVNVSYQGRELKATGAVNVANNVISNHVDVTYQTDIYIVTDNGVQGNWNFNNGTQMTNEDGTYTATFNATLPNTFILFARKLGDGVDWNTRYVFGPDSDGDWAMPADKATEYGNIDVNDDDPIKLPYAGEYTITINGNDKTFTITRTIKTVAKPTFTPAADTYTGTQTVTIECETEDATILYKIGDGEYQPYNAPIEVAESCTITAKATKDGWNDSEEATAEYVIEIPIVHEPGDVNHDGYVNIKDVTDLIDYLLGTNNEVCEVCANVKDDGAINIADVTALIDLLLRIQTTE